MKKLLFFAAMALILAACGSKSNESGNGSPSVGDEEKVWKPADPNIVRHDCPAGTFFVKRDPEQPGGAGIAVHDRDGKFIAGFDGILDAWSGDAGLVMKRVKLAGQPYPNEWSLFSFATLQKKYIGTGAFFIKNGWFIWSMDGQSGKQMFWSLDGTLVWEGTPLQCSFLTEMEQDFWVGLSFSDAAPIWLDLTTGNILPYNSGETYPDVGEMGIGNGYEDEVDDPE